MDHVAIRPAAPADLDAVHSLVERAYRGEGSRRGWTHEDDLLEGARIPAEALRAILADPRQILLLAEQDGETAGCVRITGKGADTAHLGCFRSIRIARRGASGAAWSPRPKRRRCARSVPRGWK
jgi:hypothetical protein